MICVVKRAVLLLLLAGVIGSDPVPSPEGCEGLNKPLPRNDLHKIFGDWVLVWSVTDNAHGWQMEPKINSSHVELRLLPDNKTISFIERNLHINKSCSIYSLNMSFPLDSSDSNQHTLHTDVATEDMDGVVKPYNDSGVLDLYESCPDCLVVVYRSPETGRVSGTSFIKLFTTEFQIFVIRNLLQK
ncbi:saxitoxin and tetrodotoxin-binding protein 1-like protein [Lates japonicus]|uniref:Saxitoxin and tetrodotoxin-binding protein 1-like protein n=1 Tax=Lates japonicus TaxID=270547 RepID=A0AAD3R949_LATJO|nr:saxitoxin and tetrodotoxin-binding protein 1-like protein [Lates japonicus]